MNRLGIDVVTEDAELLCAELRVLPEVLCAIVGAAYRMDPKYTQVFVDTTVTSFDMDEWLYNECSANYVGVFEVAKC